MRLAGVLRHRLAGAVAALWAVFWQPADVLFVHGYHQENHAVKYSSVPGLHRQPGCNHSAASSSSTFHLLSHVSNRSSSRSQPGSQNATAQRTNRGEKEDDEADGRQDHGLGECSQQTFEPMEESSRSFEAQLKCAHLIITLR